MRTNRAVVVPWIILGIMLRGVSTVFEGYGDAAPYAGYGNVSGERLLWHVMALLFMFGAGACFIKILINIVRQYRSPAMTDELARVFEDEPPPHGPSPAREGFDTDAALARYRARQHPAEPAPQAPPRGGFGKKGL